MNPKDFRRIAYASLFLLLIIQGSSILKPDTFAAAEARETTVFLSYLGGDGNEHIAAMEIDHDGNTLILGTTDSTDYPYFEDFFVDKIGYVQRFGVTDVFLAKVSNEGELVFYVHIGGSEEDTAYDLAINELGEIAIIGKTFSRDFPTTNNAFYPNHRGGYYDAFICIFSPLGDLQYSSFFGGFDNDVGTGIIFENSTTFLITGWTRSINFPVVSPHQEDLAGEHDIFLTRFIQSGENVTYSTYFGSEGIEYPSFDGKTITLNDDGSIIIAGTAFNSSILFPGYPLPDNVTIDTFVAIFDTFGNLTYYTVIDLGEDEFATAITIDESGVIYLSGIKRLNLTINIGGELEYVLRYHGFISRIDSWSPGAPLVKVMIGVLDIIPSSLTIMANGSLIASGWTNSGNYPSYNELYEYVSNNDVFITMFTPDTLDITFSSFIGGSDDEAEGRIAIDPDGRVVVVGITSSIDLILVGPFQNFKGDGGYGFDAFFYCFDLNLRGQIGQDFPLATFVLIAMTPPVVTGLLLIIYPLFSRRLKGRSSD